MKKIRNTKGFTLIELLVVLAIIGVLIALAIVGLRAAQSSQRDASRKDVAATLNSQLQSWLSNTSQQPPATIAALFAAGGFFGAGCNTGGSTSSGSNNGILAGGVCIGLDGFAAPTAGTVHACPFPVASISTTDMNICYDLSSTASPPNPYRLGVGLESNTTYYVSP